MKLHFISAGLVVSCFSLVGCLGGGGSSDSGSSSSSNNSSSSSTSSQTVLVGQFIDRPVKGLRYETASQSGYTGKFGEFSYKQGEQVTFSIGDLEIGSAEGAPVVSPLSLAGESDLETIGTKATNIARVLQTLDQDPTNKGIIEIPVSLRSFNLAGVGFNSEADLNSVLAAARDITNQNYQLVVVSDAQAEMKEMIPLFTNYPTLTNGTFNGVSGSSYYWLLNMPEDGYLTYMADYHGSSENHALLFNPDGSPFMRSNDSGYSRQVT